MISFGIEWAHKGQDMENKMEKKHYYLEASQDPSLFPGRQASVKLKDNGTQTTIGILGIIHPEVLENFGLNFPVSTLIIELDIFLQHFFQQHDLPNNTSIEK